MPTSPVGARPTLFLALVMSFLGITGVAHSYILLSAHPAIEAADPTASQFFTLFGELSIASSLCRGAAVANLIASGLLTIASFLLTARRPSAIWCSSQALWANLAYTAGNAMTVVWLTREHALGLSQALTRDLAAQAAAQHVPATPVGSGELVWLMGAGVAVGALVMAALYAVLLRLSRRPDVRRFVEEAAAAD